MVLEGWGINGTIVRVHSLPSARGGKTPQVNPERRNLTHVLVRNLPHPRQQPGDPAQPPALGREEFNLLPTSSILRYSERSSGRYALRRRGPHAGQ